MVGPRPPVGVHRRAARWVIVEDMTFLSTTVRATHLVTNAAWFGGSLMGATGLERPSSVGDDSQERAEISSDGWSTWGPIQGGAVALHLLSGLAIVADNRRRTALHPPTLAAVVLKTALTGAAVAASAAAYANGHALGEAVKHQDHHPAARARPTTCATGCAGCGGRRPPPPAVCSCSTPTWVSSSAGRPGCSTAPSPRSAVDDEAFEFSWDTGYRVAGLAFGVRPANAWVEVDETELRVHYGPWRLRTTLANIASTELSSDFAFVKTAGPPHLSLWTGDHLRHERADRAVPVPARAGQGHRPDRAHPAPRGDAHRRGSSCAGGALATRT